ncbi:MAG TPA: HAMP domain-containing sensor histidine kinase [Burkholderiales bacterium]
MNELSKQESLQRRLTVAYLMFAIAACVLFTVIAIVAVEGIEERLVDQRLKSVVSWASPRHIAGLPVEMPAGVIFYHGESIPVSLRGLEPGVQEKSVDGVDLRLFVGRDAAGDFVAVDRESDYEKIEAVVYSIVAAGLGALLILSIVLGRYIGRRFVGPISTLAEAVMARDSTAELPLLKSRDELGVLARAFSARTTELQKFLVRERFFTGDVSHELRTSLTIIIGAAEILVERTAGQPGLNAPADRILRAAKEAGEFVTVLLLLARAPELIDAPETRLGPVIEKEIESGRRLCGGKPVSLESFVEGDPAVFARRELLAAAIGNLVRNACQYTAKGNVTIRASRQSVTVEDTGPGLPEGVRERLASNLPVYGAADSAGSGIGLALVKRICEHLGATLRVNDRPAGGTAFTIDFPPGLTKS